MGGGKDTWNDISKKLWAKLKLIFEFEYMKIEKTQFKKFWEEH